jgi:hypothetical protein
MNKYFEGELPSIPETILDQDKILDRLYDEVAVKFDLDLEEVDAAGLIGQDDNDFIGNLATFALMHDLDHEEFFGMLGIEMPTGVEIGNETE